MLKALWAAGTRRIDRKQTPQNLAVEDFSVLWRQSARRTRSLALRIDKSGQLIAMTPVSTSEKALRRFILSRRDWIATQLTQHAEQQIASDQALGESVRFMGEQLNIQMQLGPANKIKHQADCLIIIGRQQLSREVLDKRAKKWLRCQAENILAEGLEGVSERIGLQGSGLQIKRYTARWGSCRHDGLIQLNWKLIMAPPEVIDYVIVHELCHLKDFNHSKRFWARVAKHCPTYQTQRKWLRQNGQVLLSEA